MDFVPKIFCYIIDYRIFGHTFNFGFSAKEKKAAATALNNVIVHVADKTTLAPHQGAFNNGELQSIYALYTPKGDVQWA